MNRHAARVLEFAEALEIVARSASSALGAEAVRALRPTTDAGWIGAELQRVDEMGVLLRGNGAWSLPAIPDLRRPLEQLRVDGSVWEASQLRDACDLLIASRTARRTIVPQEAALPSLATLAEPLLDAPRLEEAISRAIGPDGKVWDDASPELKRLRREMNGVRARIVERLVAFAASLAPQYQVPDASVTVREGRYVIPVRREGRSQVGGIVHDESGTGATLFVEPPVAIEMMNRLREIEAAEHREVLRILRELTQQLRPHRTELQASLEVLVMLDSLLARARYAAVVEGCCPVLLLDDSGRYEVVNGRHPILLARAELVVPFDLRMEPGERTLLISGPNTGGKTVLLKAIGLISLLAQSGVVPPVGQGTRLPVFREVFADIGDEQSIEASLSTFSAHLRNLRETLDGAERGSLVLIDEIGSGTDPTEGGALARAVLVELTRRGAFTVATTHLGQLKLLAVEEANIVNASLQFDAERLEPTFRLIKGVPGRSYGLAIARRLGLPTGLLDEAERALPQGERDVARLLLDLEASEQRLAENCRELESRLGSVARLQAQLEVREQKLRQKERDAERRSRQQARDMLLQARQEVEEAIREVRSVAVDGSEAVDEAARSARRRVEEAARRQKARTPETSTDVRAASSPAPAELSVGCRVRIESLGRTGTLLDLRDGKAMVEAGGLRLLLSTEDLSPLPAGDEQPRRTTRAGSFSGGSGYAAAIDASHEIDLRGLRPDEIELRLARALDAAIMAGLPTFRIIHGKGLGVLRDRVQAILQDDPRVAMLRPGERFEGGTGVTVAEFA